MFDLIGLSGYARSGKDTVANYLVKHGYNGRPVVRASFADPMRDVVRWFRGDIGKLRESNPEGYRADLQFLGEYLRSRVFLDVWVAGMQRTYSRLRCSSLHPVVVVTDLRYPNELDWLRNHGGALWFIRKPGASRVNDHESEQHYDYIAATADHTINNDGTLEDLEAAVVRLGNGRAASGTDQDSLSSTGGSGE